MPRCLRAVQCVQRYVVVTATGARVYRDRRSCRARMPCAARVRCCSAEIPRAAAETSMRYHDGWRRVIIATLHFDRERLERNADMSPRCRAAQRGRCVARAATCECARRRGSRATRGMMSARHSFSARRFIATYAPTTSFADPLALPSAAQPLCCCLYAFITRYVAPPPFPRVYAKIMPPRRWLPPALMRVIDSTIFRRSCRAPEKIRLPCLRAMLQDAYARQRRRHTHAYLPPSASSLCHLHMV